MVNAPVILVVSPVKTYARSAAGKTGFHAAKIGFNFGIFRSCLFFYALKRASPFGSSILDFN